MRTRPEPDADFRTMVRYCISASSPSSTVTVSVVGTYRRSVTPVRVFLLRWLTYPGPCDAGRRCDSTAMLGAGSIEHRELIYCTTLFQKIDNFWSTPGWTPSPTNTARAAGAGGGGAGGRAGRRGRAGRGGSRKPHVGARSHRSSHTRKRGEKP